MRLTGGILLTGVALFMLLGFATSDTDYPILVDMLALGVGVGIPGFFGVSLIASHRRGGALAASRREELRRQTMQAEILRLARSHGARLTVAEVVTELGLSAGEVDAQFRVMAEQGVAEVEVTESGLLVYAFPDIARLGDKSSSRGVLEP